MKATLYLGFILRLFTILNFVQKRGKERDKQTDKEERDRDKSRLDRQERVRLKEKMCTHPFSFSPSSSSLQH